MNTAKDLGPESAIWRGVAAEPFSDLLTRRREPFQHEVLQRLRERCAKYAQLGIELKEISLHDLHPPQEVVQGYHDVARAMQARERQVNVAEADAIRKNRASLSTALNIERQASASAVESTEQAKAAQSSFLSRHEMRNRLGMESEIRLLWKALADLRTGRSPDSVYHDYLLERRQSLAQQKTLTDFRLFWDALTRALAGREKIIIDADQVPGKRHLWLVDPEQFRMPLPATQLERGTGGQRSSKTDGQGTSQ